MSMLALVDAVDLDRALDRRGCAVLADGDQRVVAARPSDLERRAGREVGGRDAEAAEVDPVLVGRGAAGGVEAVDDVVAEADGVVDDGVDAAADVDGVVAGAADDGVVVVAAVERVVAVAAVEQVVAVIAVERVVAAAAEELVGARRCR